MKGPSHYVITRKKDSKPESAMRVIVADKPADSPDAGLGNGGVFYFLPGQEHSIPAHAAAEFMADAYHADHFDIDPPLPKKLIVEAEKANEARLEEPAPVVETPAQDTRSVKGRK